jgi:DNA-binding transcriptional LysR family regulator
MEAMDPLPDLNLLDAFAALYAERSVTRAARRRGIGQPAMSAALARLRALFDDPLFVRAGATLRPTPLAEALAPGIASALAGMRAALAEAAPFAPARATRGFTIGASDYATLALLPTVLAEMRRAAPGVRLRVLGYGKDDAAGLLDRGEVDLLLGMFRDPPPRAVATLLFREQFVGLARRGHPAVVAGAITLERFLAHPHALFTVRGDLAGAIDDVLARRGLARQVMLSVPHLLTLPALLAGSDLLAAVPARIGRVLMPDVTQVFALPFATDAWRMMMLWNATTRRDPALAWLRGLVRAAAAQA